MSKSICPTIFLSVLLACCGSDSDHTVLREETALVCVGQMRYESSGDSLWTDIKPTTLLIQQGGPSLDVSSRDRVSFAGYSLEGQVKDDGTSIYISYSQTGDPFPRRFALDKHTGDGLFTAMRGEEVLAFYNIRKCKPAKAVVQ